MMQASAFVKHYGGRLIGDDFELRHLNIDSRNIQKDEVFWALAGAHHDGAQFAAAAVKAGASALVLTQPQEALPVPQLIVADTEQALNQLAAWKRAHSSARFIGLTGSNGKTSSKEMLAAVLRTQGKVYATKGNLNNHLGVPLSLAQLAGDEAFVVIEMGANHAGEIAHLSALLQPHIGLITNISAAHLAGFGSLQGVIECKEALYAAAQDIVLNMELDEALRQRWEALFADKIRCRYGLHQGEIQALLADDLGQRFRILPFNLEIEWTRYGTHNVSNALGVAAVVQLLGLPPSALNALNHFEMDSGGRLQILNIGAHRLINDSYNANPASFRAALQVLSALPGEKHVFAGAMKELGADSVAAHQSIRAEALRLGCHFYAVDCEAYGGSIYAKNEAKALVHNLLTQQEAQSILIKGSRSAQMEALLPSF